jgi:SAM-dependent methyltransferase
MTGTARQKELFEEIHNRYYESSADVYANAFKEEYVYSWVLSHIGNSRTLIELACGTGAAAGWLRLRKPDLEIAGCDISDRAVQDFMAKHHRPCFVADLTKPLDIGQKFDAVIIMGGIHHLVADLDTAFRNISNLLNDGGRIIMAEPNADYMLEPIRKLWYKLDKANFDTENEAALSHQELFEHYGRDFKLAGLKYFGGPAYFLLCLNWILRIPSSAKKWIAPSLMAGERLYSKLPGRWPHASFLACWKKQ